MAEMAAPQRVQPSSLFMRLAGLVLCVLVALAGIVWVLPGLLDWNNYRGAIGRFATHELGRPVTIEGPISVVLLPAPLLTAQDVRLGDSGDGISMVAPALQLRLAFAPLLVGRVAPRALVLRQPQIHLPWPLPPASLASDGPGWLGGSSARIEGGRVNVGGVTLSDVTAALSSGEAGLAVHGAGRALGGQWRFVDRLGAADGKGDAPLDASFEEEGEGGKAAPAGVQFAGVLTHAGGLRGQVTGHVGDVSALVAGPALPATVAGQIAFGDGPARARLAVSVGGADLDLRLQPGEDGMQRVFVSTGRLDVDRWRAAAFRHQAAGMTPALAAFGSAGPVRLDLAAEAVRWRGGLLRSVHAVIDLDGERGGLRSADAVLPGEAALHLAGVLTLGGGDGDGQQTRAAGAWPGVAFAGTFGLEAPQLHQTLQWLTASGVRLGGALPEEVLRTAKLAGQVRWRGGRVDLDGITGQVEQSNISGQVGVELASGAVDAAVGLDRIDGDSWLPPGSALDWARLSRGLAGVSLALRLHAGELSFRGETVSGFVLDGATDAGGIAVNGADGDLDGLHVHLAGTIDRDGEVSGAALDLGAAQGTALARHLPAWLQFTPELWAGPVRLHLEATGAQTALHVSLGLDLADARLEAHPTIDLASGRWAAQMTLRHPGAPRLLSALGLANPQAWLGEGSLSLLASLSGGPGRVDVGSFDLTAGTLHVSGDLHGAQATGAQGKLGRAMLTGAIAADTLPLPVLALRGHEPVGLGWLGGFDAKLGVTADSVLAGDTDVVHGAVGSVTLEGGTLSVAVTRAQLGGGTLTGQVVVDSGASPPRIAAKAAIGGANLSGPLFGTPLDLTGGRFAGTLDVAGQGYSPDAVLASLGGTLQASATNGSLVGVNLAAVVQAGADAGGLRQAVGGGLTRFDTLLADATVAEGLVTLKRLDFAGPDGAIAVTGTVDLPQGQLDLLAHLPGGNTLRVRGAAGAPARVVGPG
jgi:hypothetical protein